MDGSSWHNSGLTFDDPPGFVDLEESSSSGAVARETMSNEWTDEKHSLYIASLEASFVEQLYNSKNSFGWCPQTKHDSNMKSCASGQIKHLRRPDPQPEVRGRENLANARNKHFRVRGKRDVASSSVQDKQSSSGGHFSYYSGSRDFSEQFTEVSDQNFTDEGCEPNRALER